ncbi:MAG: division/cell wall cluster transcriptional repressor MraZ [Propionibacteriaceae bacterium]|nr:division/cell wall cluster transcriptional repressor MraZ [Propionibacteriaceae bacterium]
MFFGTFTPKMDAKGRFALPAKFRAELEDGLIICRGYDNCLNIWARADFEKEKAETIKGPSRSKRTRLMQRAIFSSASNEMWDEQGRLLVPPPLREYAGLDKELVVNGVDNRIEVWDAKAWEKALAEIEAIFADTDIDEDEDE